MEEAKVKSEETPEVVPTLTLKLEDESMKYDTLLIQYNDLLRKEQMRKEHKKSVMKKYNVFKKAGDMMGTLHKKIGSLNIFVTELQYKIENNKLESLNYKEIRKNVDNGVSYYNSMCSSLLGLRLISLSFDIDYNQDGRMYLNNLLHKSRSLLENARYSWVKTEEITDAYERLVTADTYVNNLGYEIKQIYQKLFLNEIK